MQNGESALVTIALNFSGNVSESQTININGIYDDITAESVGGSCILTNISRSCQFMINVGEYASESQFILDITNDGNLPIVTGNNLTINLPSWNYVGESNISNGVVANSGIGLALDENNNPYIAYVDKDNNLIVKYYFNGSWISLGEIASSRLVDEQPQIFILNDGSVNVIYVDHDYKILQKSYVNGSWSPSLEIGSGEHVSFATNGVASYIAYTDVDDLLQVKKLDDGSWVSLYHETSVGLLPQLALNNSGSLYMSYMDEYGNLLVYKKNSGEDDWKQIGGTVFNGVVSENMSIVVSSDDVIYVAFTPRSFGEMFVKTFTNDTWEYINGVYNEGDGYMGQHGSIFYNNMNNILYANVIDEYNSLNVLKFVNNEWQPVGSSFGWVGFSTYALPSTSISSNGSIFVAFDNNEDNRLDEVNVGFASVKKYGY